MLARYADKPRTAVENMRTITSGKASVSGGQVMYLFYGNNNTETIESHISEELRHLENKLEC